MRSYCDVYEPPDELFTLSGPYLPSELSEETSMFHETGIPFNDTSMNSDYIIQDLESRPERLDSEHLMRWIMHTCNQNNRNYEDINLRYFQDFSDVRNATEKDFSNACKNRNYNLGSWLYTKWRQHIDVPTTDRFENILRFSPPPDDYLFKSFKSECVAQSSGSDGEAEPVVQKRQRGRPKSSNKTRRKSEHKTGKLWEFLRDLLLNPDYCPAIICWENHDEGVFKFVSSEKVAKLWGSKRGNNVMNYEKLSRAMRYYYKTQVLAPVLGKRLVYRFGVNAKGWRTDNPNFLKPHNYTSKL